MRRTLRAKFVNTKVNTRGQVLEALDGTLATRELVAIYKTGEGAEWYLTFATASQTEHFGDGQRRGLANGSGAVYFDRIDRRVVKFKIHWFPLHLRKELVAEWLKRYGSAIQIEEEITDYGGLKLKTGALKGIMKSTEEQYLSIPYRGMVYNRPVLVTVLGRQPVCLKCGQKGHQRSTCPQNGQNTTKKSYAESARAGLEEGSGESTPLSVDVPRTNSSEGSTGRPDVHSSSEGSPVPDVLSTSSGEGTQPSADVPFSSEGPGEDRCTDSSEDPPQDRGTESMDMSKTRKRGRDESDDTTEGEGEDNGKKIVKEEEPERTGPLTLPIKNPVTIDVD